MISQDPYPMRFHPLMKQTIWGGEKLSTLLGKPASGHGNDAESWEIVDHGDDQSVVTNGALAGSTLADLISQDPSWILGSSQTEGQFPLLLKFLDCNRVLSVQVHPDDSYGAKMPVPDRGKTEAWYVVAAQPDSLIYAGLKAGVDRKALGEAIHAGQTERVLHSFHPQVGDCVFIPAGTVHALGAGLVIAEIQQSSDTTFRLFDWNRVGNDGNPRQLHVEQSLDVTDYESGPVAPIRGDNSQPGWQTLVDCDKFILQSISSGTATLAGDNACHILTVPQGAATIEFAGDKSELLTQGQSVLLPAAMDRCEVVPADESVVLHAAPR